MISQRDMAILTSIVNAAALHFDCDNIDRLAVVGATGLRINIDSTDSRDSTGFWNILGHVGNRVQPMVSTPIETVPIAD